MNINTHSQAVEKNWTELKGKIKSKWSKFNDQEIESVKGNLSDLADKIQKTYGVGEDSAIQQFDEFKRSVESLIGGNEASKPAVAEMAKSEMTKPTLVPSPEKEVKTG
jgi:uncharacterized protein YjbJ (UPF0337 family)